MTDVIYGLGANKMPEESIEGVLFLPTKSMGSPAMEKAYLGNKPERAIGVGFCGGMQENMEKGDLVVVTESVDGGTFAEYTTMDLNDWLDRREEFSFKADEDLTNQLKQTLDDKKIRYHEGKIFSVSGLAVETPEFIKEISRRGYTGVEMETATLFACASHENKKAASLQVVSDMFGEPFDLDIPKIYWRKTLELALKSLKIQI